MAEIKQNERSRIHLAEDWVSLKHQFEMTALFSAFPAMVPADSFVEIDGTGLKLNWNYKEPKNSHAVRCSLRIELF